MCNYHNRNHKNQSGQHGCYKTAKKTFFAGRNKKLICQTAACIIRCPFFYGCIIEHSLVFPTGGFVIFLLLAKASFKSLHEITAFI